MNIQFKDPNALNYTCSSLQLAELTGVCFDVSFSFFHIKLDSTDITQQLIGSKQINNCSYSHIPCDQTVKEVNSCVQSRLNQFQIQFHICNLLLSVVMHSFYSMLLHCFASVEFVSCLTVSTRTDWCWYVPSTWNCQKLLFESATGQAASVRKE